MSEAENSRKSPQNPPALAVGRFSVSVGEAIRRITADVEPLSAETVSLDAAHGRILAAELTALLSQPPFPSSAVDGYAVRAGDAAPGARLLVAGESAAGQGFPGRLQPGQAIRIFTGAPLPAAADAVVMQERARRHGLVVDGSVVDGPVVEILEAAQPGGFIRPLGSDFRAGDALLHAGCKLSASNLMLAASMNRAEIPVRRQPEVAILATGDELVAPGRTPGPGQIIASTPCGLAPLARSAGGRPRLLGVARDRLDSLHAALDEAEGADILLTVGGTGQGDHDLLREALAQRGFIAAFHQVAMQPGKSTLFGRLGPQRALCAPGSPTAALLCARLFLVPLIAALLGARAHPEDPATATLAAPLPANGERQRYIPAVLTLDGEGNRVAAPLGAPGLSGAALLSRADGFILRPPFAAATAPGAHVSVLDMAC